MKFIPATKVPIAKAPAASPGVQFRYLTSGETKIHAAELSGMIVKLVQNEVVRRLTTPPGEPEFTSADGMQVAISAMAAAEGILAVEAFKTGLPIEKIREIHDNIFTAVLRRQMT